jgi:hypothetical protein
MFDLDYDRREAAIIEKLLKNDIIERERERDRQNLT